MKRTQIGDFEKIDKASDLNEVVKDKREGKRANKQKTNRRNRQYEKTLLKQLSTKGINDE